MLVLSRNEGQEVVIGNDIRVVVVEVRGDRVKLGFEAPNRLVVMRKELIDKAREEQKNEE